MRSVLISTSLSYFICFWLASRCSQRSPSQQRFPRALQLKEQFLKEQISDWKKSFQDVVSSVSFWLRSFPVHGWWTRSDDGHAPSGWWTRALLRPPELLRPMLNRHLDRGVEPLVGERHPPVSQPGPKSSRKSRQPGDVGVCSFSGDGESSAAPSPGGGLGILCFVYFSSHFLKERAISFSSGFSGPWDDSVQRHASSLSPTTHLASSQESVVRGRSTSPRTSSQFRLGPREFGKDASEHAAFCTIQPYSPLLHHHR